MVPYLGPEMIEFLLAWFCPREGESGTAGKPPSAQRSEDPLEEIDTRTNEEQFSTRIICVSERGAPLKIKLTEFPRSR